MAESITGGGDVKNIVEMEADVNVEFNEAASRQQINSGESIKTLFGKLRKFLTDLKAVAFSGAYSDLSDKPESLPANGGNADTVDGLHANEIASNPNLLINPDFKINQRNRKGWAVVDDDNGEPIPATQVYVMDRWRIIDGTIHAGDEIVLNGTIIQVLENGIGENFTATVNVLSGTATASYDDTTRTFTIVGNNAVLNWAKLEHGSNATQFFPPDTAAELLKCMRYYEILLPSAVDRSVVGYLETNMAAGFDIKFSVPKRCPPTLISNGAARIVVNTIGSYIAISNNCAIKQNAVDNHGITIFTVDPIISSSPTGYTAVTMDALSVVDIAVDAEIY